MVSPPQSTCEQKASEQCRCNAGKHIDAGVPVAGLDGARLVQSSIFGILCVTEAGSETPRAPEVVLCHISLATGLQLRGRGILCWPRAEPLSCREFYA